MAWYEIGAIVIATMFVLNAVVFVTRARKRQAAAGRVPLARRPQSRGQSGLVLLFVGAWVACFGAAQVAPETSLGRAMSAPWALASLALWLMAAAVAVVSVMELLRRRRARDGR